MSTPRIRVTMVIMDILDVLMNTPPDSPAWGLQLCEQTAHGPSTVYPAMDRLLKAGWVDAWWEEPPPEDRPKRRYYSITSVGSAAYQEAVATRAARRADWATRTAHAGGTA
jgi:PadR family transcriptional regulator, regulatory protein PadR